MGEQRKSRVKDAWDNCQQNRCSLQISLLFWWQLCVRISRHFILGTMVTRINEEGESQTSGVQLPICSVAAREFEHYMQIGGEWRVTEKWLNYFGFTAQSQVGVIRPVHTNELKRRKLSSALTFLLHRSAELYWSQNWIDRNTNIFVG